MSLTYIPNFNRELSPEERTHLKSCPKRWCGKLCGLTGLLWDVKCYEKYNKKRELMIKQRRGVASHILSGLMLSQLNQIVCEYINYN